MEWMIAIVAVAAIECVRKVDAQSWLLVRWFGAEWRLREPQPRWGRILMLESFLGADVVILSVKRSTSEKPSPIDARLADVLNSRITSLVHLACLVVFCLFCVGVPRFARTDGVIGLILSSCIVANLCVMAGVAAFIAVRCLHHRMPRSGSSTRFHLVSPFALPILGATLMELALEGESATSVVRAAVSPSELGRFIRNDWYDFRHGGSFSSKRPLSLALIENMEPEELETALLKSLPSPISSHGFCPRCAATFVEGIKVCSDCSSHPTLIRANGEDSSLRPSEK